jgi:DNA-binding NarL/FixJ family response regulator
MDHLMPGMDGFQAVQAIKNNPLTATIPIMMYTSQEGELYLSQARALGAIGVLPKQTKHTDVSKALDQLRLLAEPRLDSDLIAVPGEPMPGEAPPPVEPPRIEGRPLGEDTSTM